MEDETYSYVQCREISILLSWKTFHLEKKKPEGELCEFSIRQGIFKEFKDTIPDIRNQKLKDGTTRADYLIRKICNLYWSNNNKIVLRFFEH